jgi:hypothetical protein
MFALAPSLPRAADPDTEFIALLGAYRPSGGLARAADLSLRWSECDPGGQLRLARWIAFRRVVSLRWAGAHWVPMFQFQQQRLAPRPCVGIVLDELRPVFSDWEVARWFATPNPWLGDRLPAGLLSADTAAVFQAARADRFAVTG